MCVCVSKAIVMVPLLVQAHTRAGKRHPCSDGICFSGFVVKVERTRWSELKTQFFS